MAFNVTARTVPCSLNCSLAVFVPRETQCQGELTDPVEVRKSASQRRCDPATEQKEGSWVKETFPSYLAPLCASLTRRDTQVYAHCRLQGPPACLPLRAPTPYSYFSCWWTQQHTVVENLDSDCLGSKPGSTTACRPRTRCQSLGCCFCPVGTRTLATSGGIF